jgi:hypothetical protein
MSARCHNSLFRLFIAPRKHTTMDELSLPSRSYPPRSDTNTVVPNKRVVPVNMAPYFTHCYKTFATAKAVANTNEHLGVTPRAGRGGKTH